MRLLNRTSRRTRALIAIIILALTIDIACNLASTAKKINVFEIKDLNINQTCSNQNIIETNNDAVCLALSFFKRDMIRNQKQIPYKGWEIKGGNKNLGQGAKLWEIFIRSSWGKAPSTSCSVAFITEDNYLSWKKERDCSFDK